MYREIARALIDQRGLDTVGPADQAADDFAIMMMTKPRHVPEIGFGFVATRLYWLKAHEQAGTGVQTETQTRSDRVVCLWVGADPAPREHVARADGTSWQEVYACAEEYRRAAARWRGALGSSSKPFYPVGAPSPFYFGALPRGKRIRIPSDMELGIPFRSNLLGVDLTLPRPTPIVLRACGEPAVRYDPAVPEIVLCYEMLPELDRLAKLLPAPPR